MKLFSRWLIALSLIICAGVACAAHPHTPELGAAAVIDSNGVVWAVYKSEQHVVMRNSKDFGATWSAPQDVNAKPEAISAGGDARPKIAAGPNGELYVTWTKPLAKPYTGDIRFARSLDGGKTFSEPVTVHTDRQEITHRFDAIAVDRSGRIYLAWIDKRDLEAAKANKQSYDGAAIYAAISDDRGASFRGDFKVADHSCECCRIALLARDEGLTLLWRHLFAPNIRDHAIARLSAQGKVSGLRRATFDDWGVDACPHHGPSLTEDKKGDLHAVWYTQGDRREGVYYGRLKSDGIEQMRKIGGDGAVHADIASNGQHLAITWKEFDGTQTLLRALISVDGGATWLERELGATTEASSQPFLLQHRERFFVFWHTRNERLRIMPMP